MSFKNFKLKPEFVASIEAAGYETPTPLQSQLIPLVADRKSVLVLSQSAAGKTGAFLIPAINYILENPAPEKRGARILILTSRRDRVSQINYTIKRLSGEHNMRFGFIVSGRPYQTQMRLMRRPLDIMIATPGRLNDLMDNKKADFSQLEMLIVDDFSSIYQKNLHTLIENILRQAGEDCPSLVFASNDDSAPLARTIFKQAQVIEVEETDDALPEHIKPIEITVKPMPSESGQKRSKKPAASVPDNPMPHAVYIADDYTHKIALMDHFMDEFAGEPTIIYTSSQKVAGTLRDNLTNHGHSTELVKELTDQVIESGDIETLIVHDQDKLNHLKKLFGNPDIHLIHFDLPLRSPKFIKRLNNHDNEREEAAILIVDGHNYNELKQVEKLLTNEIQKSTVPGLEPLQPFVNKSPAPSTKNQKTKKGNRKTPAKTKNSPNNASDKSRRQRKGPFGRLNGGAQRKQDGNTNQQRSAKRNNNRNRKIGVSSMGTGAPTSDRAWQADFAEPQERKAKSKRVVIRYKDNKRALLTDKLSEDN